MGTIRKIGEDYYIEFAARGLSYQRNGGPDKEAAMDLLKDIEEKIRQGEMSIVVHDEPVGQFFNDVAAVLKEDEAPKTYIRYTSVISHFQEFTKHCLPPNAKMSHITPRVIEDYRLHLSQSANAHGKPLKPRLMNFTILLLKDILDRAINFGHINDNPTLHTKFFDEPSSRVPDTIEEDGLRQLKGEIPEGPLTVLLGTGIGLNELLRLKRTNVDLLKNCLTIESEPEESRMSRSIPMDSAVLAVIRPLCAQEGEKLFAQDDLMRMQAISPKCLGLLRNTFAQSVLNKGVSLIGLNRILGYRDIARVMPFFNFIKK